MNAPCIINFNDGDGICSTPGISYLSDKPAELLADHTYLIRSPGPCIYGTGRRISLKLELLGIAHWDHIREKELISNNVLTE